MARYPEQVEKLALLFARGDQRRSGRNEAVAPALLQQDFADLLGVSSSSLSKYMRGHQRFPASRIGGPHDYVRSGEAGAPVKHPTIEWDLLSEIAGLDGDVDTLERFHDWFTHGRAADFDRVKLANRSGNGPGEDALFTLSTLVVRYAKPGFSAITAKDPHRFGESAAFRAARGLGFAAERWTVPRVTLKTGAPAWVSFRSPVARDGKTPLWKGWSVTLLERRAGSNEVIAILPGVEEHPGWSAARFDGAFVTFPSGTATEETNTRWKPEPSDVGKAFDLICIASRIALPDAIRSAIRRPDGGDPVPQPDTAPGFLALAVWLRPLLEDGSAGIATVGYRVAAP